MKKLLSTLVISLSLTSNVQAASIDGFNAVSELYNLNVICGLGLDPTKIERRAASEGDALGWLPDEIKLEFEAANRLVMYEYLDNRTDTCFEAKIFSGVLLHMEVDLK